MTYQFTNSKGATYYLHGKDVTLRGGRSQRIYFFSKNQTDGAIDEVPAGFVVMESKRTGLPILTRKKA